LLLGSNLDGLIIAYLLIILLRTQTILVELRKQEKHLVLLVYPVIFAMKYRDAITVFCALLLATSSYTLALLEPSIAMSAPSQQNIGPLPRQIKANILTDAAQRSQTRRSLWKIKRAQAMTWVPFHGGDGPSQPMAGTIPTAQPVPGWKVVVNGPQQTWVYYAYVAKEGFELDALKSVPRSLVNEAISQAVRSSGRPAESFRLHWVEYQSWQDTCLGIVINQRICPKSSKSFPGWRIQVISSSNNPAQIWTFHSRLRQDVRLQGSSSWQPPQ
jgi:hypothetical protein